MSVVTFNLFAVSTGWLALLAGVIVVVGIAVTILLQRRRRNVWQEFAEANNVDVETEDRPLRLSGEIDGRRFELQTAATSSDTGELGVEEIVMSVAIDCPHWPVGMRIESATSFIGDIEAHRTPTGHEAFDRDLLVSGCDRAAACGWLTDARRLALMDLAAEHSDKSIALDGQRLSLQTRSAVSRRRQLDEMWKSLRRAAIHIESIEIDSPQHSQAIEPHVRTSS